MQEKIEKPTQEEIDEMEQKASEIMNEEQMEASQERQDKILETEEQRLISTADHISPFRRQDFGRGELVQDPGADKPRLEVGDKALERHKYEMEADLKRRKVYEKLKDVLQHRYYPGSDLISFRVSNFHPAPEGEEEQDFGPMSDGNEIVGRLLELSQESAKVMVYNSEKGDFVMMGVQDIDLEDINYINVKHGARREYLDVMKREIEFKGAEKNERGFNVLTRFKIEE